MDFEGLVLGPVLEHFGRPVTYTPPGGGEALPIAKAVFQEAYQFVEVGDVPISTVAPVLLLPLVAFDDARPLERRGVFVVDGKSYTVAEPRPTGNGGVLVILHRVKS